MTQNGTTSDKSLSQLLEEAGRQMTNFPPGPGVCHAVICLNRNGKPASADDHISSIGYCRSTRFIWSEEDQAEMCAACWTVRSV